LRNNPSSTIALNRTIVFGSGAATIVTEPFCGVFTIALKLESSKVILLSMMVEIPVVDPAVKFTKARTPDPLTPVNPVRVSAVFFIVPALLSIVPAT
jgi:hypothetical protein